MKTLSLFPSRKSVSAASSVPVVPNLLQKLKRQMAIFLTSAFLLLGPVQLNTNSPISFHPPSAHASTASISLQSSKSNAQNNVDKIINQYVQKNMFNDDLYDPVESTYRETITDATASTSTSYPSALSSAAQSILGKKLAKEATSGSSAGTEGNSIKFVLKLVDTIHVKFNVPKPLIVPGLFLVFGGVLLCWFWRG
jgi:hypothetical protein